MDQELRYPWKFLILNKGSTVFYVFKSRSKQASTWVDTSKIAVKVDIALKNKVLDNNLTVLGGSILTNILYLVFISPCDHKFSPPCFSLFEVLLSCFSLSFPVFFNFPYIKYKINKSIVYDMLDIMQQAFKFHLVSNSCYGFSVSF